MLEQTSGNISLTKTMKVHINLCQRTSSFSGTASTFARPQSFVFYHWRHLRPLVYSAPIENEETLHQRIFDARQIIYHRPRTFEAVLQFMFRRVHACTDSGGTHFEHLLWAATWYIMRTQHLYNLEQRAANVLCNLSITYYKVKVFVVEQDIPIKLKNHSSPDTFFSLFSCEQLSLLKYVHTF